MANADSAGKLAPKVETTHLRVYIHCEGCRKKVKKILTRIEGVYTVEIDASLGKVTVTGTADAKTIMKKLEKSGKVVELWPPPMQPIIKAPPALQKEKKEREKEKEKEKEEKGQPQEDQKPADKVAGNQLNAESSEGVSKKKAEEPEKKKKGGEEATPSNQSANKGSNKKANNGGGESGKKSNDAPDKASNGGGESGKKSNGAAPDNNNKPKPSEGGGNHTNGSNAAAATNKNKSKASNNGGGASNANNANSKKADTSSEAEGEKASAATPSNKKSNSNSANNAEKGGNNSSNKKVLEEGVLVEADADDFFVDTSSPSPSKSMANKHMAPLPMVLVETSEYSPGMESAEDYATHMFSDENANNCTLM